MFLRYELHVLDGKLLFGLAFLFELFEILFEKVYRFLEYLFLLGQWFRIVHHNEQRVDIRLLL